MWKCVSPILILLGLFGNLLSLSVVWKLKFWCKTPLFLLAVLSVTDLTVLLDGLLRYWVKYTFEFDLRALSNGSCKVNLFVLYLSMQYSSWILVCITADRFIKTNFPFVYLRRMTITKTLISIVIIFILLSGVNLHYFWTNGLINGTCDSLKDEYLDFEENKVVYIDLTFMSLVPSIIMVILNCFINRALRQQMTFRNQTVVEFKTHNKIANRRKFSRKLTRMLLIVSCYFIASTLPFSIYNIYDTYVKPKDTLSKQKKSFVRTFTYLFQYSNYSLNFIWYAAHNKVFRNMMKESIGFKPNGYVFHA